MTPATTVPVGAQAAERELVFLCARLELEGAARQRVEALLQEPLEWSDVLKWAGYHHVTPLLHHHLDRADMAGVPQTIRTELRARYHAIAARNLKLSVELQGLLQELDAEGAPAVIWKGPVLARSIYPSPELRTFADLDLIIRQEDRERARTVFSRRGYGAPPQSRLSEDELFAADAQDATLWNPRTSIPLDVHWGTLARYYSPVIDFQKLWHEGEPFELLGTMVRALRRDTLFLALCVHGAKHRPFPWPALKWVTDLEAFLRVCPDGWWPPVLDRARRLGCLRMALLGVCLARELLDAPVPPLVAEAIDGDPIVTSLVPSIRSRILDPPDTPFPFGDRIAFDLAVRERFRDRIRYRLMRLVTPSARDDFGEITAGGGWFRVPLRLLRLSRTYLLRPGALLELLRREDRHGSGDGP